jgi:AraC-like DNA-binding protein
MRDVTTGPFASLISDGRPVLYEHYLSKDNPVWASATPHPAPTPLDLHLHRAVEVGIGITGRKEIHFGETMISAGPGAVWLCAMWEPHAWRAATGGTRTVTLVFLPEFLGEEMVGELPWLSLFAVSPAARPRVRSPVMREHMLQMAKQLCLEIEERRPAWRTLIRLDLLRVLTMLAREWQPARTRGRGPDVRASSLARIMPALALVHAGPDHHVSLAQAARSCSLSRSQFSLLFTHTMGLSFGRFRQRARLTLVAHRLLDTEITIETIAAQAGFANGSHLHHAFLREYGCTPRQYRDRARHPAAPRQRALSVRD